jgi:gamma-glutamyltranspeptidase / glutathione hydrolase
MTAVRRQITIVFLIAILGLVPLAAPAADSAQAVEARHGMVVCASAPAADVGVAILKVGGNAVDAAVATAFAMAVTYPVAGNIGGGGFMLIHPPHGQPTVIDYREAAPTAATADMFVKGYDPYGHKVVGVPGTVRGLELAHKKYGKLPWKQVVEPAIKLAADGFLLEPWSANSLNALVGGTSNHPELRRVFSKGGAYSNWSAGDRLVQPDLAQTLRLIADQGADTFYTGPIADLLVAEMKTGDGLITKADLAGYRAIERQPVHGTYRGYDVYTPPAPSAGGVALAEMLNVLDAFDLKKNGRWSAETLHSMTEAMRRAFCDRARFLGDPAFTPVPEYLTAKDYGKKLAAGIDPNHATPSSSLAKDIPLSDGEGDDTTHLSVIDKDGLAVANTYTLENSYGSRVVVRGAGFLLNNEMTDFNIRPGVTTRSGAVGTPPNQIAPGKRMVSSQTPTIVAKNGQVFLVSGSPGSKTIPNTVLCVVVNVIDFEMDIQAAVDAPRMHHAWFPDELRMEQIRAHPEVMEALRAMGHRVVSERTQGDAHSILVDPKTGAFLGAADHRIMGKAAGF